VRRVTLRAQRGHGSGAPRTRRWTEDRLQQAHQAVTLNRSLGCQSTECGCCYRLAVFPASAIKLWTDGSRQGARLAG
jgi:hypothetical protein